MSTSEDKSRFPEFTNRFCQLRDKFGSYTALANVLGITRQTVSTYCNGTRIPDSLALRDIAVKCNVSADWLLGISDVQISDASVQQVCDYTGFSEETVANFDRLKKDVDGVMPVQVLDRFLYDYDGSMLSLLERTARLTHLRQAVPIADQLEVTILTGSGSHEAKQKAVIDFIEQMIDDDDIQPQSRALLQTVRLLLLSNVSNAIKALFGQFGQTDDAYNPYDIDGKNLVNYYKNSIMRTFEKVLDNYVSHESVHDKVLTKAFAEKYSIYIDVP